MKTVTRVRMESSSNPRTHEHIAGVCTTEPLSYTRAQVVASIRSGERWVTSSGGNTAEIREIPSCSVVYGCPATPYITTAADASKANNLDNLPRC